MLIKDQNPFSERVECSSHTLRDDIFRVDFSQGTTKQDVVKDKSNSTQKDNERYQRIGNSGKANTCLQWDKGKFDLAPNSRAIGQ